MSPLTPVQALRFAIDFAHADDVSGASEQVRRFVVTPDAPIQDWTPQSAEALQALQATIRALLYKLVDQGFAVVERNVKTLLVRAGQPRRPAANYQPATVDQVIDVSPIADRFLNRVIRSLEDVGLENLQVCQAPLAGSDDATCGRLFLKVTNKEFCSTRCQARTYMRGYIPKGSRHGKKTRTR